MARCLLLVVLGCATSISITQPAVAQAPQEETQTQPQNHFEFHVVGDVQAPGAHPSTLQQEMLVNLLKIARLFPAESYQLRLVRNGTVEWEADVPSDKVTPSIQLQSDDILLVGSQQRSIGHTSPSRNSDDSSEVAIVVPGQKVEFKFITAGTTAEQISLANQAGPIQKIIPIAGDIQTSQPEKRIVQDGDVLLFSAPVPDGLLTDSPSIASTPQQHPAQSQEPFGPQFPTDQIPTIATSQLAQPQISTANLITDADSSRNPFPETGPVIIPAVPTAPGLDSTSLTVQIVANNSLTIPGSQAESGAIQIRDAEAIEGHSGRNAAESHPAIDVLQTGIVISDSSASFQSPAEPLSTYGFGQTATINEVTDSAAIRTALQDELHTNPQTLDLLAPEPGIDDVTAPFDAMDNDVAHRQGTNQLADTAPPTIVSASIAADSAVEQSTELIGGAAQSTELARSLGKGLSDSFRSSAESSGDTSEESRRKYSSVLFVLLLLGSITSLIFIWSKKGDDSIEKRLKQFRNYGEGVIPKVKAAMPKVRMPNVSLPSDSLPNVALPGDSKSVETNAIPADRSETTEFEENPPLTRSVAESRLDRLIQNSVRVSQEVNRKPRTFTLNSEPLGPRRHRIDAAAPQIRGPHFQVAAPIQSQSDATGEIQSPSPNGELTAFGTRIDTASVTSVPRQHYSEVPEGTLDRALNSIEGVSRT